MTLWMGSCGALPVHCRILSTPSLYPLEATVNQKCFQIWPSVPSGHNCPELRTINTAPLQSGLFNRMHLCKLLFFFSEHTCCLLVSLRIMMSGTSPTFWRTQLGRRSMKMPGAKVDWVAAAKPSVNTLQDGYLLLNFTAC